ncbi:MAG: mannose-ethanolamine phosphotransferase gpi13 [Thelocarpon superellum]|nr:MAG: mannose-ethanolamine phosphotransferase gpi13 [Thelocarpon superellum]
MADGLPDYKSLHAQYAQARRRKEREQEVVSRRSQRPEQSSAPEELRFKTSHLLLVVLFSWFLLLHVLGLYFFTKGFLLTRLVLDDQSECAISPLAPDDDHDQANGSPAAGCWHPKSFEKAVVIIVDALRYDFTVPFHPVSEGEAPHHFHNALPFFYDTAVQQPHNAFLLPFIADPPTTTLQRLKGLTTGTLPTFIDAGSNFAGTAIEEDNLISQLRSAGKNVVHLGDDTWHSLFPGYFDANLTRKYDSFNVWDLHTVDNGVTEHLIPLLQPANTSRWDVLIGHYLGVDHAGHRYGPDHPAMTAKLQQMDAVFREVISLLDDSTLLVVMGDHGMDVKGDHGGESFDEVQAALWMYSKKGIFGRRTPEVVHPPASAHERPVAQIDLVPTLALLLGLPIPFNNLGAPIEEAFLGRDGRNWENLAVASRLAGAQIKRYQSEYAKARGLDSSSTAGPLARWAEATAKWTAVASHRAKASATEWTETYDAFSIYQRETVGICRSLWARFDVASMIAGILILGAGLVLLLLYGSRLGEADIKVTPFLLVRILTGMVVGAVGGSSLSLLASDLTTPVDGVLLGCAGGGFVGLGSGMLNVSDRVRGLLPASLWSWLAIVFTVSQSIGYASNSYTIWEDEILLYFLATFGLLAAISSSRRQDLVERTLGTYQAVLFILLTRCASFSRLCREEQMPYCRSTYYASANSSTSAVWQLFIPFLLAIILPDIIKSYYRGTRSFEGAAVFWIGFAFRIGLLLAAVFWALDAADDGEWFTFGEGVLKTIRMSIAQLVLAIALAAGSTYYVWAKPCVSIATTRPGGGGSNGTASASLMDTDNGPTSTVTVLGYANTHGSRYVLLLTNFALAVLLLQKPMGHLSIGILVWQILCLMEILDTNALSGSVIGPVVLGLLGNFHFFKTGHQATLASIQWESAFIPLRTIQYPWSPLLVLGNTYGAQILATLAVPLVVMWKQPPKQPGLLANVARAITANMAFHATIHLACTMWAGHLRRHLMLYRIFSPRWMTSGAVLVFCDVVAIWIGLVAVRPNALSVAEVFGW